jgi:hypothetical protein
MKKMNVWWIALLMAGQMGWQGALAQDLPVAQYIETEASDVEVCQDFICSKLREEILVEASKCRPLASFKRRRMRVKRSRAANSCKLYRSAESNFKSSKGKCSAAIREACEHSGIDAKDLNVNAYDLHKKGLMERAGFVNMIWKYDEVTAPLGAILIYVGGIGHRYGHVEVRVNPNLYCSDYCNQHAVTSNSSRTSSRYKLVGVYLPFTSSIQEINAAVTVPKPGRN